MDGRFIHRSALIGVAQVSARFLGVLFSIVVAKLYTPAQFGDIRYLIALATVVVIPTNALPRTLSRFVAKHRVESQTLADTYFTNSLVLLGGSGIVVIGAAIAAAMVLHHQSVGLIALCVGISLFAIYFELLRSVERFYAMTAFYIVSNVLQLLVVMAAATAHLYSVTLVLCAYGLSCVFPLIYIELTQRSPVRFRRQSVSRPVLRELAAFSLPLLVAHGAYTAWFNVDLLLVVHLLGPVAGANYALSKTLTMVFVFVPYATTTVVLPRFVQAQDRKGAAYLQATLLASVTTSTALLLALTACGQLVLHVVFHNKYPMAAMTLAPLALGMALYSIYLVLEAWVVSIGRPHLHAISMMTTMVATLGSDMLLIPVAGSRGAGVGFLIGAAVGLITLGCSAWLTRPRRVEVTGRLSALGAAPPALSSAEEGKL